jgi:hypothetical protein
MATDIKINFETQINSRQNQAVESIKSSADGTIYLNSETNQHLSIRRRISI